MMPEPPNPDELLPRLLAAWPLLELRHRRRLLREAEQLAGTAVLEHKSTLPPVVPGEGAWVHIETAARAWGVARSTAANWIKRGKVRRSKAEQIGGAMHIAPDEIERLQTERKKP